MLGLNLRFRQNLHEDPGALGRQAKTYVHKQGALTTMHIDINKVPSRAKKIVVSIEPAKWQMYIAH